MSASRRRMLTCIAVRRRCTLTWSLSATSTPASRPPPVVSIPFRTNAGYNSSQWDRLDLQVRWYRQAYHREVREGTDHLPLSGSTTCISVFVREASSGLIAHEGHFWWGCASFLRSDASPRRELANLNTMPRTEDRKLGFVQALWSPTPLFFDHNNANNSYRKPPNSARVPSSTHGSLTSSRPSVSVVSPSISLSGSSRPPSTTSLSLMLPVTVISSRT